MGAKRISVRVAAPIAFAIATMVSGWSCILLVDKDADQCQTDSDCAAKGGEFAGRVCEQNVCVTRVADTGGNPGDTGGDTKNLDTGIVDSVPLDAETETDAGDPTAGVFVIGGTTAAGGVLSVFDPLTGSQLATEDMDVAAVAYDPGISTGGGDVFYVFEKKGNAATEAGVVPAATLHVRTFDSAQGKWTEITSLPNVPLPLTTSTQPPNVVVMNKRMYILAPPTGSDPNVVGELVIVDISNPGLPVLVAAGDPANVVKKGVSSDVYLGHLVGGRADDTFTGGTVGLPFSNACSGAPATCPNFFQRFRYTGNDGPDVPGTETSFGAYTTDTTVGYGYSARLKAAFMVVPGTPNAQVLQNPQTFFLAAGATPDAVATFPYSGRPTFSPVAIDDCDDVALFTAFTDKLYAVPFTSTGMSPTTIDGALASDIAFEPRTKVVAYISSGSVQVARLATSPAVSLTPISWPTLGFTATFITARSPMTACGK